MHIQELVLLGLQVAVLGQLWDLPPIHALRATLTALQNRLLQAAQGTLDAGFMCQGLHRFCRLCQQGVLGAGKHLVFERPAFAGFA